MKIVDKTKENFSQLDLASEFWLPVPSLVGLWVSTLGRVCFLVKHPNNGDFNYFWRITSGVADKRGYRHLKYKTEQYKVHRLVAKTFIDNSFPLKCNTKDEKLKYQIDHIDTNPNNNRLSNLRICTNVENSNNPISKAKLQGVNNPMYGVRLYGSRNGFYGKKHSEQTKQKISECAKKRIGCNNPVWKGNIQALKDGIVVAEFNSWDSIITFIKTQSTRKSTITGSITSCCRGTQKTAYGYEWRRITK